MSTKKFGQPDFFEVEVMFTLIEPSGEPYAMISRYLVDGYDDLIDQIYEGMKLNTFVSKYEIVMTDEVRRLISTAYDEEHLIW